MRKFVFSVFAAVTVASTAFGARPVAPSDARMVFHVGPGFLVGGGSVEPGVGVGFAKRVTRIPIHVGLDSGVFFRTSPSINFIIPVLPMVYYRFPTNAEVVPTLGLGLGPIFAFGNGAKTVDFMLMVNPGFEFYLDTDMDLFFRSSLGFVGSSFVFYPQIGATFRM